MQRKALIAMTLLMTTACAEDPGPPRQPRIIDRSLPAADAARDAALDAARPGPDAALDAARPGPDAARPGDAGPAGPDAALPPTRPGWRLTWHDEFDAPAGAPIDPSRWVHDVGGDGWGNQQLEHNTDRPENASHDGQGHLVITAREEAYRGNRYTSARIKTQDRFTQRYGRFEARIQLPIGQGLWPAFWMLGEDIPEVGWPRCGEIDIMEFRGQRPRESTGAIHGPGYSAGAALGGAYASPTPLPDDFHVFAVEWDAAGITWFVDDDEFLRLGPGDQPPGAPWAYDHPFFLILNIAVGGNYVGAPNASTRFPQQMRVDYVRVWEAAP